MRLIDADEIICKMESVMDMQDVYLPVHFMEMVIDNMPTIEVEPTCEQIKRERDQAIKQLESYGVKFCDQAEVRKVVHGHWTEKKFPGGGCGTGYDIHSALPDEIEKMYPDYSIYPECDYAIGYITRGCPNHCRWCIVPKKEGGIKPYRTWKELIRPDSDKLVLMDNNILACEYGIEQLESLIDSGYKIDLNQGMDARLVTARIAEILSQLKWIKYIRFSCDTKAQITAIENAAEPLQRHGVKPYKLFIYLLVTPDLKDAAYRVERLKRLSGITIYAQAERNERLGIIPNKMQLEFAQRYVYSGKYRKETWQEYCKRLNLKEN